MKSAPAQTPPLIKSKRHSGTRSATRDPTTPTRGAITVGPDGVVRVSVSLSADIRKIEVEVIRRVIAASDLLVANGNTAPNDDVAPPPRGGNTARHSVHVNNKGIRIQAQNVSTPASAGLGVNQVLVSALMSGMGMEGSGRRRAFKSDGVQQLLQQIIEATDPGSRHAMLESIEELLALYQNPAGPRATDATEMVVQRLRQQSAASRADAVRAGRLIQGKELADRLNLVRQSISAALKSNRLFAFKLEHGRLYYPAFFADEQYDRSALEAVSKVLGNLPAGSKWDFFMHARPSLQGMTPLEALKNGQLDAVRRAAQAFAEC